MVHALETVHGLLKKDGLLIDIHPNGTPPPVEVHLDGEVLLAGHVEETGGPTDYFAADAALADVTTRGLFELEREELFPFMTHAPTIMALTGYLAADWSDAVLPEAVIERLEALMRAPGGDREIVVREIIRFSRFRASGR